MTLYQVTVGDQSVRVEVLRSESEVMVRVNDGLAESAVLRHLHGALYTLAVGDRSVEFAAATETDEVRLVLGGLEYSANVVDEARARLAAVTGARAAAHAHVELKAPMPGLLVRVLCEVGDEVQPGQPLAVLQAMKMENELSLARGGRVSKVNVTAGQTVEQGQVLLILD
jgi:biotin carboxyl carrier protein